MGILVNTISNLNTGIDNFLYNGSKIDGNQLEALSKKKQDFLTKNDEDKSSYVKTIGQISIEVFKDYLSSISKIYRASELDDTNIENRFAFFEVTKWVHDPEENNIKKMMNVYQTLADTDCNIGLIYDRDHTGCHIYLAVLYNKNDARTKDKIRALASNLEQSLRGNFPGIEFKKNEKGRAISIGTPDCFDYELDDLVISSITNIPSEKTEDFMTQSMEKLIDGVVPETDERYTLLLLAEPARNLEEKKIRLYDLYSSIAHYSQFQESISSQEMLSEGSTSNVGVNAQHGWFKSASVGLDGIGVSAGSNTSLGIMYGKAAVENISYSETKGITRTHINYTVKHILDLLEREIHRLDEGKALGMWDFSAYVLSNNSKLNKNVSRMYLALTQGEQSFIGRSAINYWIDEPTEIENIYKSVSCLQHPTFILTEDVQDENALLFPEIIDCTTSLTGKELALALNFPKKSVVGIPVLECASFGRDIQRYNSEDASEEITIGHIVHMRQVEDTIVNLDVNSLTSHTFITGSTGTGKTTTTLQLLSNLIKRNSSLHFLVVEPTKGEYRKKIGGLANVYGTNKQQEAYILRLNPFWFPSGISVLEHIDRLVEILNACWPMYAAMPAILKDAIERAYLDKGWNLDEDNYINDFPTFFDLMDTLPLVVSESDYSGDTKSDYSGALITRVKSLTNGLNGTMFCNEYALSDEELFENNVIIDISRIGSMETKALVMGTIILRLQEYWMSKGEILDDSELKHITVLEEAHNLLKKTATGQSQESANLQGKSVEMITNSIAEMRAYGEGFIIADQAPNLLDEAVIRNTNTKIILRLPDEADRITVGKACSMSDRQIVELAKIPNHVAAVYQNNWVEPVLCGFERYESIPQKPVQDAVTNHSYNVVKYISFLFDEKNKVELTDEEVLDAVKWVNHSRYGVSTKKKLKKAFVTKDIDRKALAYNLFDGKKIANTLLENYDEAASIGIANSYIKSKFGLDNDALVNDICMYIILQICELNFNAEFVERYRDIAARGGLL